MSIVNNTVTSGESNVPLCLFKTMPELLLAKANEFAQIGKSILAIDAESKEMRHFNKFEEESRKIASAMSNAGLQKGDIVIFMQSDLIRQHIFLTGVWRANGVCRASYPDDDAVTLENRIRESECKFILCDAKQIELCQKATEKIDWQVLLITSKKHPGFNSLDDILESNDTALCPSLEVDENDPAMILNTSGTTGPAKGAVLTHKAITQDAYYLSFQPFTEHKVNLFCCTTSYYSGTAFPAGVLVAGKTALFSQAKSKELLCQVVAEMKPGFVFAMIANLLGLVGPEAEKYDVSSLEVLYVGGSMVTPSIRSALFKLPSVKDMSIVYGMSECGIVVTTAKFSPTVDTPTFRDVPDFSVGKPRPGVSVQVRDPETLQPLGPLQRGEICLLSESNFHSYYKNSEATNKTFIDGYLRTGDIGYYDEQGFIYVVDRLKEIFKYLGSHISPSELENEIAQHPRVQNVCVVGVPDPDHLGDLPRAFVTIFGDNTEGLAEEIKEFANSKLANYKHLRGGLYIVPELPRGKTGKIARNLVAQIKV